MNKRQDRILDTLIYFLDRYKNATASHKNASGFEDVVFGEMIETIKELREENHRLGNLNKPKIIKGDEDE